MAWVVWVVRMSAVVAARVVWCWLGSWWLRDRRLRGWRFRSGR